jgi:putative Mn2+ efflux pump MntP
MRLPAVAIAAAFACGILLGLHPVVARNATSLLILSCSFAIIAVLVVTGLLFVKTSRLFLAAIASLLSWVLLGFLGVCIAEQPRDPDYVISLIEQGRLPYMC